MALVSRHICALLVGSMVSLGCMPERIVTIRMYVSVSFSLLGAHRRMMSLNFVHLCFVTYVCINFMAARIPCSMSQNVSNSWSSDGVTFPIQSDELLRMFIGLQFLIPRGVFVIVGKLVVDA